MGGRARLAAVDTSDLADVDAPSRRWVSAAAVVLLVIGAGLLIGAWVRSGSDGPASDGPSVRLSAPPAGSVGQAGATTAPTTPEVGLGEGVAPERHGRSPLRGFGEATVTVTGRDGTVCELCVMAATTEAQRARGLMEVTDAGLGGYDAMIFEYPDPVGGAFYMRNTPMPLSIGYFDDAGGFVSATDMTPCEDREGCPTYPAAAPFRYAVEVPEGALGDVGIADGSTVAITGRTCPVAAGS